MGLPKNTPKFFSACESFTPVNPLPLPPSISPPHIAIFNFLARRRLDPLDDSCCRSAALAPAPARRLPSALASANRCRHPPSLTLALADLHWRPPRASLASSEPRFVRGPQRKGRSAGTVPGAGGGSVLVKCSMASWATRERRGCRSPRNSEGPNSQGPPPCQGRTSDFKHYIFGGAV